jgi:hypothetical protein
MSNDALVKGFLGFFENQFSGGARKKDDRFALYSQRLDSVKPGRLKDVLDGIMADTRVESLPSLAAICHKLAGTGNAEQLIPENRNCSRGCRRGEVLLLDKEGYDFIAPCDCSSGKLAKLARVFQVASYIDGESVRWFDAKNPRRFVKDVIDYANEGIGPADIAPPLTPKQREWVRARTEAVGLPAAAKEFVEAMAKHRAAASIESERTADEREKQADHAQRQTRDW